MSTYSISATARSGRAALRPFQQTVLDQPAHPAAPGHVGAHSQITVLGVDHRAGPGVANPVGHGVFGSGDARDDPDHRLIGAKARGDFGFAALAIPQFAGFRRLVVRGTDVDQLIASGFREQPPGFLRREPQLLAVDVVRGDGAGRGAEILQLERKHRDPDRRRRGRFGGPGRGEPCKHYCRSEDERDVAHGSALEPLIWRWSPFRPIRGRRETAIFPGVGRVKYPILPSTLRHGEICSYS